MDFWQVFWLMVWAFFFVAYLIVLFQIIADLFRDEELSGWWKALWIIALLFIPVITALIYLIARGRGMSRRQMQLVQRRKAETDDYIRTVATASPAEQIAQAKALLADGSINEAEFEVLKAKAINSN
ncbi:Phospholipase_D-nuclease N-terminal [Paraoerskovia marina]|uniref:Phospholipase_D-nuclease N-terminal n=1 Tax=Paraoerskovia marina TaxID=545619 RepID=A0A1H1NBC4_9CELL|nr:SHOCT domain-containing protein [Paraoerskovia marina]SDR96253.1 Phospholipase_D-nuclease N-terminal [Paraoerskovia marina]